MKANEVFDCYGHILECVAEVESIIALIFLHSLLVFFDIHCL